MLQVACENSLHSQQDARHQYSCTSTMLLQHTVQMGYRMASKRPHWDIHTSNEPQDAHFNDKSMSPTGALAQP